MRLDGKKALITGAGSYGIGRAIALAFAREGATVAIHYHSRPDVAASVVADIEALGPASFALQADLSEAEPCRELVRAAHERLGGLDVIVTAAAAIYRRPILEITEDAEALTQAIMAAGILPPHAFPDAAHVAVSAVHAVDYLLTWNCKHLANAQISRRIAVVCEKVGHRMPIVCTPEDAYRCFMGTDMDCLVIGNVVLHKAAQTNARIEYRQGALALD